MTPNGSNSNSESKPIPKRALVARVLGFLGVTSSPAPVPETAPTPPPTPPAAPVNGVAGNHEETLGELAVSAEGAPPTPGRSSWEDTHIINLGKQSDDLSAELEKKSDTCRKRLLGVQQKIRERLRETEDPDGAD